jgi:hypothetical protein
MLTAPAVEVDATVRAHLRYFGEARRSAVLERLGLSEVEWSRVRLRAAHSIEAGIAAGDTRDAVRWRSERDLTEARLRRSRPMPRSWPTVPRRHGRP